MTRFSLDIFLRGLDDLSMSRIPLITRDYVRLSRYIVLKINGDVYPFIDHVSILRIRR